MQPKRVGECRQETVTRNMRVAARVALQLAPHGCSVVVEHVDQSDSQSESVPAAFIRLADPSDPLRVELERGTDPNSYGVAMLAVTGIPALAFFGIALTVARKCPRDPLA